MGKGLVTVFGANGFLGRHVLRALVKDGWRIRAAVRRPHIAQDLRVNGAVGQIQLVQANVRYKQSIEQALDGANAVINLAGILYKKGNQTFDAVHVQGAQNIGDAAAARGITNVVHISALSADKGGKSDYARSKAAGEDALRTHVPSADILRPSIMFGKGDGFFTLLARLTQITPALPLIGGGKTRLQPVYVGDAAEAVAKTVGQGSNGKTYELGGPNSYTFKELVKFTLGAVDKKRVLLPMPWFVSGLIGFAFEFWGAIPIINLLIKPIITRDQVKLLKSDHVLSGDLPGLSELGIHAETIEAIVPPSLEPFMKYGQFHQQEAG